jgi:tRNA/tmRNA/rRNA uracil-C5-methylase (TrmA/RlmC/RlmD family)
VIADPARPGLGPAASAALAGLGAERLVLVSCDPASFARDVGLLAGHGYRLAQTQVLDLFPHTFHVEAVSRFERG